ncbi:MULTISPECIES: hypothetical protein [Paracoccaceae]|uniref:hypothetical protein n=1 Tax=Paracoccaceae TaxID=31989 RepID=UPI00329936F3
MIEKLANFYRLGLLLTLMIGTAAIAEPLVVKGLIDYDNPESSNLDLFDLSHHDGKVVWLELEMLQSDLANSLGYSIEVVSLDALDKQSSLFSGSSSKIVCGNVENGYVGLVPNARSSYLVSLTSPSDFHSPTEIHIGDRVRFPFHSVYCDDQGVGDLSATKLVLRGHFVVASVAIPTAQTTYLFPIHIHSFQEH